MKIKLLAVLAVAILALTALSKGVWAKVEPRDEDSAINPEPAVTVVEDTDKTLQIHQINGKVYGIRVIPKNGKPYNLVDPDGEGKFVREPGSSRLLVPEWTLIRW